MPSAESRFAQLIAQVLDSSPKELRAWRNRVLPDLATQAYVEVLVHFEEGDVEQLASASRYISLDETPTVYWLANTLWGISVGNVELETVLHLLDSTPESNVWRGEALFVAASSLHDLDRQADAKALYLASADALSFIGAKKKALYATKIAESLPMEASLNPLHTLRRQQANSKLPLTKLERNLLRLIGEKPLTKFEIVEKIFGAFSLYQGAEARIDSVLADLERKRPYLVRKDRIRYFATG